MRSLPTIGASVRMSAMNQPPWNVVLPCLFIALALAAFVIGVLAIRSPARMSELVSRWDSRVYGRNDPPQPASKTRVTGIFFVIIAPIMIALGASLLIQALSA
jgi:hypothetical protein